MLVPVTVMGMFVAAICMLVRRSGAARTALWASGNERAGHVAVRPARGSTEKEAGANAVTPSASAIRARHFVVVFILRNKRVLVLQPMLVRDLRSLCNNFKNIVLFSAGWQGF
jgi:hypothetical protein